MSGYANYNEIILNFSADYTRQFWASGTSPLYGPNTPSMLMGSNEGNFIQGGNGDDTIYVIHTADRISGGAGVDTAYATVNFTLPSDVENLTMDARWSPVTGVANDRDNIIRAVNAGVTLDGAGGDDVIFSAGGDTFIFGAGSGKDVLVGFQPGSDTVRLSGYALDDFAAVKAAMTKVGADTLLRLSANDLVLFKGVSPDAFTAKDFELPISTNGMKLTFAEEFDTLNLKVSGSPGGWSTAYDWAGYADHSAHTIAGESAIYVDPTFAGAGGAALGINPFSTADGVLTISAAQTSPEAKAALWGHDYSSGLITTSGTFAQTYGYFEMRADLPSGQGAFPAFWLLPQDGSYDGEIDVMEMVNGGDQMWNHIHYRTSEGSDWSHQGFAATVPSLTEGFHTFGVLWSPETITWFVDGTAVNSTATPAALDKPMYMLANYAVGGSWAGAPDGSPLADMKIDYIRAYSLDAAPVAAPGAKTHLTIAASTDSVVEGTGGTRYAEFTVTRTGDLSGPTTAAWTVTSDLADATDFGGALPSGQVSFGGGEATKTIWIPISGDKTVEADESFTVTLGEPNGADVVNGSAMMVIANDDVAKGGSAGGSAIVTAPAPVVASGAEFSIAADAASVVEGDAGVSYARFTVTRAGDLSGPSTATWSVAGSGAGAADVADFGGVLPSGQVFFGGGEATKTIWVPISGDTYVEGVDSFTVSLSSPTGAALGVASASTLILDDDGPHMSSAPVPSAAATLAIVSNSARVMEPEAGVSYATFTVNRTGDLSGPSTAAWAVKGTGAQPVTAADFDQGHFPSGLVFFGGGEASKTIWVPITGADGGEADETFSVYLSNPTDAVLGVSEASAVIIDPLWSGNTGL